MKSKIAIHCLSIAAALHLGTLASSAQTNQYLFTGSETNITLSPGIYIITAYGAQGGTASSFIGGLGAEMEGQFNFSTSTTLTLLVGGAGGSGNSAGGGGGGSFVVNGSTPLVIAGGGGGGCFSGNGGSGSASQSGEGGGGGGGYSSGGGGGFSSDGGNSSYANAAGGGGSFLDGGGGGSGYPGGGFGGGGGSNGGGGGGGGYSGGGGGGVGAGGGGGGSIIDSSAITNLVEVSGIASPDDSPNGEIIIITVPAPPLGISAYRGQPAVFFPTITGTNYLLQMSTNLASTNWVTISNGISISGLIITNPPANAFFRLQ